MHKICYLESPSGRDQFENPGQKGKGKVVPVLLSEHNAMKHIGGVEV
jgi:hypothetical protein